MSNPISIIGQGRLNMIGDCVAALPVFTYFQKIYPNALQTLYLDQKLHQLLSLLSNQSNIHSIRLSARPNAFDEEDRALFSSYGLALDPFCPVRNSEYYNYHSVHKEVFLMTRSFTRPEHWIDEKEYDKLTEEEKSPRLMRWFETPRLDKTIAIWPSAGHGNADPTIAQRSPSKQWWRFLILDLYKLGYKVRVYGHPRSEFVGFEDEENGLNLSLFDAVKESLGCDLCVGTDSGSMHILGAYGARQIVLHSNYLPNWHQGFQNMCPRNWKNNLSLIFGKDNINNISREEVLAAIGDLA